MLGRQTGIASIGRRLQELGYGSYQEYLASEHWQAVRKRFYASKLVTRDKDRRPCCDACLASNKPLSLHHKTYKALGKEKAWHLCLLCKDCHEGVHRLNVDGRNLWAATKKFVRLAAKQRKRR